MHHDALRMVFRQVAGEWVQENPGKVPGCSLEVNDYGDERTFSAHCDRIQSTADLAEGSLFRAGLFRGANGDYLLLVAHHLVVDGVSWRIILDDLANCYAQCTTGISPKLPLKTDSFKYWQDKQAEYAKTEALLEEDAHWAAIESVPVPPLPLDNPGGSNLVKDLSSRSVLLDESLTRLLLTQCYKTYHTEANEILLMALCLALKDRFGLDQVLLKLEGHGREPIGTDLDVTRTIGWFTTEYPVVFNTGRHGDAIGQLLEVKEDLRRVPNKGIGYGVLKYRSAKPYTLDPEITFNYLGDFGGGAAEQQGAPHGREISEAMQRDTVLMVSAIVVQSRLRLAIAYSTEQYNESTIADLLEKFQLRLTDLIGRLSSESRAYAPAPVPENGITGKAANGRITATAEVHPGHRHLPNASYNQLFYLSEWQLVSDVLVLSHTFTSLDLAALRTALTWLFERHEILRTGFVLADGKVKQNVTPTEAFAFELNDSAALSESTIKAIIAREQSRKFNLSDSPLFHLQVLASENGSRTVVFTLHHILTDGYSNGILLRELLQLYNAALSGTAAALAPLPFQYRDFSNWQRKFLCSPEGPEHKKYWLKKLAGFNPEIKFPLLQPAGQDDRCSIALTFTIGGAFFENLEGFARKNNLTRASLLMGGLTLLLNQVTGYEDITLATPVSARNSKHFGALDISGLIGYFVNILFVRNHTTLDTPVIDHLRKVQHSFTESLNYADYPFTKLVNELPGIVPSTEFLNSVVFYNYHNYGYLKEATDQGDKEAKTENEFSSRCTFGLSVAEYKNCFKLDMLFDPGTFDQLQRVEIKTLYLLILQQILDGADVSIARMKGRLLEEIDMTYSD